VIAELVARATHASSLPRQFVKYVLVGAANTALSFLVYRLLLLAGTPYVLAAPIAFIAGAVNGYWFNRRWTYAAADSTRARFLYFLFAVIGAAVTSGLVLLVVRGAGVGRGEAYLVAVPPVTVATFLANRFWTFPDPR
jgi:putative flippase GtrA